MGIRRSEDGGLVWRPGSGDDGPSRPSAGECPQCRGPLSRDASHCYCDECRVNAKCRRAACLIEEWRVDGYCSTHCADLAEVEDERDDAIAEAAVLCNRVVDLEKAVAEVLDECGDGSDFPRRAREAIQELRRVAKREGA